MHNVIYATTEIAVNSDFQAIAQELLTKVQIWAGGISVGLAGAMSMISGIMRTIGLREESKKRLKDVFIGLGITLTGPSGVWLLATVIKAIMPTPTIVAHIGSAVMIA